MSDDDDEQPRIDKMAKDMVEAHKKGEEYKRKNPRWKLKTAIWLTALAVGIVWLVLLLLL